MSDRRQPRLHDGRRSRGYVPLEVEALDAEVSLAALGFLACIRQDCNFRETDGFIFTRSLTAMAAFHGLRERDVSSLLNELAEAGLIEVEETGVRDLNFLAWCKSRAQRIQDRENWRDRASRSRDMSRRDSERDAERDQPRDADRESRAESHRESHDIELELEVEGDLSPPLVPPSPGGSGSKDPEQATVADDAIELLKFCHHAYGRPLSPIDQDGIRSWRHRFWRLSETEVRETVTETVARWNERGASMPSFAGTVERKLERRHAAKADEPRTPRTNGSSGRLGEILGSVQARASSE